MSDQLALPDEGGCPCAQRAIARRDAPGGVGRWLIARPQGGRSVRQEQTMHMMYSRM